MKRVLDDDSDDTVFDEDFFDMEETAAAEANEIDLQACEALGVSRPFINEWSGV